MIERTINVIKAAEMISCSRAHAYRLLEAGEIEGYYTGNRRGLRVIEKSVVEFIARRKEEAGVGI
ncbi:helix-turn-helix domain-containing protein [Desulfoluna butyratoxydans]|uniref:Helix-turn-helix domain n=1 Tax=Desulfoluna butyratoxydans TaxID=231438 RepID=A0A4U8YII6_9BACT|nr:helix-turn-helix domain-containing protein [Desulfoluna butyratoxydans]VFQ43495.1 helix-turn-helix domain [Desulfoluna butyratoxydans]